MTSKRESEGYYTKELNEVNVGSQSRAESVSQESGLRAANIQGSENALERGCHIERMHIFTVRMVRLLIRANEIKRPQKQ